MDLISFFWLAKLSILPQPPEPGEEKTVGPVLFHKQSRLDFPVKAIPLIALGQRDRIRLKIRVLNNILDFLYDLWVGSCHSLAADFSTIMKDLVEYDFILAESIMKERMQSA